MEKPTIAIVISVAAAAVCMVVAVRVATGSRASPIFYDQQGGLFEYDWDPTDPDFSQKACERYQVRLALVTDSFSATEASNEDWEKLAISSCNELRQKVEKRRALLDKLK